MTDPLENLPRFSPIASDQSNVDSSSTSNIPICDFRRNEARPILAEDGKYDFRQ